MNKTLQVEFSSGLGSKDQVSDQLLSRIPKVQRPVGASEKAHIFNPRSKNHDKQPRSTDLGLEEEMTNANVDESGQDTVLDDNANIEVKFDQRNEDVGLPNKEAPTLTQK